MNIISAICRKKYITQEDIQFMVQSRIQESSEETPRDKSEFSMILSGGPCIDCKKPWVKEEVENASGKYFYFRPDCECSKKARIKEHQKEKERSFSESMGIPIKYREVSIQSMDTNIAKETQAAIELVKNYVLSSRYKEKGMILGGSVGVGKTHISVSVMKRISFIERKRMFFVNASDIFSNTIDNQKDYVKSLIEYDGILLDDFDKLSTNNATEGSWKAERIFSLINGLTSNNRLILITCNYRSSEELKQHFEEAVTSRLLEACVFIDVPGEDYRQRKA